jgi:hypothetical protein
MNPVVVFIPNPEPSIIPAPMAKTFFKAPAISHPITSLLV